MATCKIAEGHLVHVHHCCIYHGCKYGNEDCPVKLGKVPQATTCERCESDGFEKIPVVPEEHFKANKLLGKWMNKPKKREELVLKIARSHNSTALLVHFTSLLAACGDGHIFELAELVEHFHEM